MVWHSKKELDYIDWKTVLKLKELGHHYTEEGLKLISLIFNQMNSRRLSTNPDKGKVVDRKLIYIEINKLLNAPSNFEIKEDGRIWIKSLNRYYSDGNNIKVQLKDKNGLIVNTFKSIASCAKFLEIHQATAKNRLQNNKAVLFNNKLLYITKEDNSN